MRSGKWTFKIGGSLGPKTGGRLPQKHVRDGRLRPMPHPSLLVRRYSCSKYRVPSLNVPSLNVPYLKVPSLNVRLPVS